MASKRYCSKARFFCCTRARRAFRSSSSRTRPTYSSCTGPSPSIRVGGGAGGRDRARRDPTSASRGG
eukprot:6877013-Prorocentrum_lima.AAC.1